MIWKTMDTAPTDGREILVYQPETNEMFVAFYDGDGDWQYAVGPDRVPIILGDGVSHWAYLPAPPGGL